MEVDVFFGGAGLWEQIQQTAAYDLIYLDIEMKDMDGITVARKIREKDPYTILIFVSAYDSYFRQLFEVEPFRFEKRIYQLPLREIVYFESNLRLIYIHGKDREYRFYGKLNQVQEQMEKMSRYFIRIQRSYLVNYYHILSMNGKEVELITGEKLPVSKEYKDRALSRYLELLGDA